MLYSRTLAPDAASASLFVIATYFYLNDDDKSLLISGGILGYSCLLKYTNVIVCTIFIFMLVLNNKPGKKQFVKIIAFFCGVIAFSRLPVVTNHCPSSVWFVVSGSLACRAFR